MNREYNVEVLNALSGAECMLYYHPNKTDGLNEVHKLVKEAMEKFHKLTGVTLNDLDELKGA